MKTFAMILALAAFAIQIVDVISLLVARARRRRASPILVVPCFLWLVAVAANKGPILLSSAAVELLLVVLVQFAVVIVALSASRFLASK